MSTTDEKRRTVSIQIVTFNSAAHIQACLTAVFAQTYPLAQVIVVDNASTDDTILLLERYPSPITLIRNDDNNGFAGGHNQAIRASTSDFVLVLNPDVTLHPDYVSELVANMSSQQAVGSATGQLRFANEPELIDSTGLKLKRNRRAVDRGQGEPIHQWQEPAEVFGVSGAAAMYARTMIEQISYEDQFFDEDFFAYKEDVDVAWRARHAGWKSLYVPGAIASHERGWKKGARKDQPLFVRQHSYINQYFLLLKNESLGGCLARLPLTLPYDLAMFGYLCIKEPKVLSAWGEFFRLFKRNWQKRKQIKALKRIY